MAEKIGLAQPAGRTETNGGECDVITAPDGSQIHVPQTVMPFDDRISHSECGSHVDAKRPNIADSKPLKIIGESRVVAHTSTDRADSAHTSHQNAATPLSGDFVVRSNGSVDGARTLTHYEDYGQHIGQIFGDPSTIQHHYLKSMAINPIERAKGLTDLGQDTIQHAAEIRQFVSDATQSTWQALRDYAVSTTIPGADPLAAQRTLDRGATAVSGLYSATIKPAVDDARALGQTIATASTSSTAAADVAVGAAGELIQVGTLVAPEGRVAKTAVESTVRIGADEVERAGTAVIKPSTFDLPKSESQPELNATVAQAKRSSRNSGVPSDLRANNDRYTKNAEKADPQVAQILPPSQRRSHHLIPASVTSDPKNRELFTGAAKAGFRTDEVSNMMLLPRDKTAQEILRNHGYDSGTLRPVHDSGHPGEIDRTKQSIEKIKDALAAEKLKPGSDAYNARACQMLRALETRTRSELQGKIRVTLAPSNASAAAVA